MPNHIKCCAHTLNLCASLDIPKTILNSKTLSSIHNRVMAKCNTLWKAVARPKSSEILLYILGYTLSRPGETRWNSLYDALKKYYKQRINIKKFFKYWKLRIRVCSLRIQLYQWTYRMCKASCYCSRYFARREIYILWHNSTSLVFIIT